MNIAQKLANFVFPSPRSNGKSPDAIRTDLPPNEANNSETPSRCQFTFSDGRQCRNQSASLCAHHASNKRPSTDAVEPEQGMSSRESHGDQELSRVNKVNESEGALSSSVDLQTLCSDLTTATNINRALSHVFLLMAQGRISQKQAVAFGYLTQLLLQTVPGIRSEYVSAHGYRAWQENLSIRLGSSGSAAKGYQQDALSPLNKVKPKTSLTPPLPAPAPLAESPVNPPQPAPSPTAPPVAQKEGEPRERARETNEQPSIGVVERENAVSSRESVLAANVYQQDELRGVKSSHQELRGAKEVITPFLPHEEVYASLYRRSLDLLDRKYDTTPEGLREAKTLMTELDLLNPKPAAVMKKESQTPLVPSIPNVPVTLKTALPELPSPAATTARPNERDVDFATPVYPAYPACPRKGESRRESCEATRRASRRPESQFRPPRRKRKAPTPPTRNEHSTDWYAPASWSGPRPDPFPSRQEKLKRRLRTMSDRRRQHQNQSRAFWR